MVPHIRWGWSGECDGEWYGWWCERDGEWDVERYVEWDVEWDGECDSGERKGERGGGPGEVRVGWFQDGEYLSFARFSMRVMWHWLVPANYRVARLRAYTL